MRVIFDELRRLIGHDDERAGDQKHGHKSEEDVAHATDHGATGGGLHIFGGHDTLEDVLLRDGTQHHGDHGGEEKHDVVKARLGQKAEQVFAGRQRNDFVGAAGLVCCEHGNDGQPDHQNDHLNEVGDSHAPHATKERVSQDRRGANDHAQGHADGTSGQHVEDQTQGRDLRRNPAQIAQDDDDGAHHFHQSAIPLTVVIADGEQGHAVKLCGKKKAHKDQASARAKRVFNDTVQTALHKLGRDTQHGLRPKPGGKGGGDDHHQRQVAPCNGEVGRGLHAFGSPQANGDGDEQVKNDQGQQHDVMSPNQSLRRLVNSACACAKQTG